MKGPTLHDSIFEAWPGLRSALPVAELGDFPTPVESLPTLAREMGAPDDVVFVKRDDLTSPIYGGNKVRTLEVLFAQARALGARRIVSTGAFGSNHAVATILHAPRVGLEPGAILFPQPHSRTALDNLRVIAARSARFRALGHWVSLPWAMSREPRSARGVDTFVMVPGGATPRGALGYVGAAFELAHQVDSGELPRPRAVVIGVGSTCTSAGLLAGFALAARRGIGFVDEAGRPAPPKLVSVRVTPWPVTARFRIVGLAVRASRLLAQLTGDSTVELDRRELSSEIEVDGRQLGGGYGEPTEAGRDAMRLFRVGGGPELDTTYSAKSAASFVERARDAHGPLVYWATKSTAPLPTISDRDLAKAPPDALVWMAQADRGAAE